MARPRTTPPTQTYLRLRRICEQEGLGGMPALSTRTGLSVDRLTKAGQRDSISRSAATAINRALGYSVGWIISGIGPEKDDAAAAAEGLIPAQLTGVVMVRGEVAAGVWKEAAEWDQAEWSPVSTIKSQYDHMNRFALVVRGQSMNLIYPDGTVLICIPFYDLRRQPRDGEKVIVQRRRGDLVEATVKQVEITSAGEVRLWPRSSSPKFQTPVDLPQVPFQFSLPDGPVSFIHGPGLEDSGEEIEITALVVGSYREE